MLHKLEPLLCSDLCWPGHPFSQLRGRTTQNSTGSCLLTWSICGPSQPLVSMLYTVPLMHLSIVYISINYISMYLPNCLPTYLHIESIYLAIYLSTYLPIHLSHLYTSSPKWDADPSSLSPDTLFWRPSWKWKIAFFDACTSNPVWKIYSKAYVKTHIYI